MTPIDGFHDFLGHGVIRAESGSTFTEDPKISITFKSVGDFTTLL